MDNKKTMDSYAPSTSTACECAEPGVWKSWWKTNSAYSVYSSIVLIGKLLQSCHFEQILHNMLRQTGPRLSLV